MRKVVECDCGYVTAGETDEDIVDRAAAHARAAHQLDLPAHLILLMARPDVEPAAPHGD